MEAVYPLDATLLVVGEPHELAPVVAHQVFMIVQEAVGNVVVHAHAATCRVGLFYNATGIAAVTEDNGGGFDAAATRRTEGSPSSSACLALHGMARAHYLRGDLSVDVTQGWGTNVRAGVPYSANGEVSRERWKVLVACTQPLVRAGLVCLLETSEPSVRVMGEQPGSLEDLVQSISLLQPDMIVLDSVLLEQYTAAQQAGPAEDSVDRPVVAVVDLPTLEQLRIAVASGVCGGFLSLESTPAEVAPAS